MPQSPPRGPKIPLAAYRPAQPVALARFFLGKQLLVRSPEGLCGGLITETEAYGGSEDKACHGFNNRRTARTEPLFAAGGIAYVYLCYGLHSMLNLVTGPEGPPMAILIRAVRINVGKNLVQQRRPGIAEKDWASGPGKVCTALGITRGDNRLSLTGNRIWLEDVGLRIPDREIVATPRIGVAYAEEWAAKPWRFVWQGLPNGLGLPKLKP